MGYWVCCLIWCSLSFLASSGKAIYKVTSADDQCMYANLTCTPKVRPTRSSTSHHYCENRTVLSVSIKMIFVLPCNTCFFLKKSGFISNRVRQYFLNTWWHQVHSDTVHNSFHEYLSKYQNLICFCISDLQSDQYNQSLPRSTMHVCFLWWRDCVPPLHPGPPSL